MKYSFHVFDHVLKTFENDKRHGFALTFNTFSCFDMIKDCNLCFKRVFYMRWRSQVVCPRFLWRKHGESNYQEWVNMEVCMKTAWRIMLFMEIL